MKLFWKFYAFLFLAILLANSFQLFNENSPRALYYSALMAFDIRYIVPYLFNILNLFLNAIACVLVFYYAFKTPALGRAPYWMFYARFLSDLTGHSYDGQLIQSSFIHGNFWGWLGLTSLILPLVPSYIAQWRLSAPPLGR